MAVIFVGGFDPITPFFQLGVPVAAALVSSLLYIWSQVRQKSVEDNLESTSASLTNLYEAHRRLAESITALSVAMANSAEQMRELGAENKDVVNRLSEISRDIDQVSQNQINTVSGLQRVIEQLIRALQES